MKLIIDEEIVLKGKDADSQATDLLNTRVYADSLQNTILSADTSERPFNIGLFGEWGSGKSSIIRTVQENLSKNKQSKYFFIQYDAWKYSGDSFRRMFLLELQRQLGVKPTEKLTRFYDNINEDAEIKHVTNTNYIYLIIVVLFVLCVLSLFGNRIGAEWQLSLATFITMATLIMNLKKHSTDDLKVTVQKSRLFAPEQFEECFDEIIEGSRKQLSPVQRLFNWIKGVDTHYDKLLIIIDNIDRCHHEMAYTLLTEIKNFLGNKQRDIIFVVPVDVDALRKHVLTKNKSNQDQANKDADEFLRKFFNVSLWIKPYHTDEMFEYADALNKKYNLGFQPSTISIVANEFATNPRRIIQLFNNLSIEYQSYDQYFLRDHQALICQLTIIREEFPDFYRLIQRDANLLFNLHSDYLQKPENSRLLLFLQRTFYISKRYEYELSTIDQILSNSNTSDSLTTQIKEIVLIPGTFKEIKSFITDNEERRQDVVTYLLTSIRKALDRGLIEADMVNIYPSYLYLVDNGIINESESQTFTNLMQSDELWDKLLPHVTEYFELHIRYAQKLIKQNNHQLIERYVNFINSQNREEPYATAVRNSILYACYYWGANEVDSLIEAFHKAYKEDPLSVFAYRYPEARVLFNDTIISEVIDQMKSDNILGQESPYHQFLQICSQIEPEKDNKHVIIFIEKLHALIPAYEYSRNNYTKLIPFIDFLNSLFGICKKISLSNAEDLRKAISHFYNRTQTSGRVRSLLLDNIDDKSFVLSFFHLFQSACLCTNSPVVSVQEVTGLITNKEWSEQTILVLYELFKSGFDISYYHESLLATSDYRAEHLEMIKYMMSTDCPEERRMNEHEIVTEIKSLVTATLDANNENDYSAFLVEIASSLNIKGLLINYLQTLSLNTLEQLPSILQKYAVEKFEEDIDNYSNTPSILMLIASCGSKLGIGRLARLLNQKLSSPGEENMALQIIEKLHYLKPSDAKLLSTTIECLELPSLSYEDKKGYIDKINRVKK